MTALALEPDWTPVLEFSSVDIFQHLPFGDMFNSLKSLSLTGDSQPNYVRFEWEADDKELRFPPTTHFVATIDDLTDVLYFDFEDIDGMDDDAREEQAQNPPFTGRWTATSSYDIWDNCIFTPSWFLPTGFALTFRACSVLPLLFPSWSLECPLTV